MRKLIFALALGALLLPSSGFTLGLGEIEVNSGLNQQLKARIGLLSAAPEDAETLIVKLASREEFTRAGLDRPLLITTLKFKTSVENGQVFVEVTSPKPIREPFLNFLVEVDWPKGHLLREYTILLDPPVFSGGSSSQKSSAASGRPSMYEAASSAPVTVESSAQAGGFRSTAPVESAPIAAPVETMVSEPVAAASYTPEPVQHQASYSAPSYAAPDGIRIQEGDTAWSIANRIKTDDSISTEQMLIAMLRANPEVFIDGNVNGLKKGYILRTPDSAAVHAVNNEEAKAAVLQQNALWREYQQSMASDQPASSIDANYTETEYSSAVDMNNDSRLSIVSAGGGASASGDMKDPSKMTEAELREQLALERERLETEKVEKEALEKQVGSLTKQVSKMKGLLTVEDDVMAQMQSGGMTDDASEEMIQQDTVTESDVELDSEVEALDAALTDEMVADTDKPAETVVEDELFVDETVEKAVDAESISELEMMDETAPNAQQEATLIDTLLNNRMVLAGLLVLVLVIGAVVYLIIKRRRGSASSKSGTVSAAAASIIESSEEDVLEDVADMIDDESVDDVVTDEEVEASMAEAEAEEEEFDADATMILPSGTDTVVTPAADLQPAAEEEEQDDVMAEADVYLAYGIYQQAEELLQNAIKENPDKDSYRVKLAETYFAGKNAEELAKLGAEMKQRLGDEETPAWTKVVAMGKELCPEAEVFQQASAAATADLDLDDIMPKTPEPMDFDLGDDSADGGLDLDFDSPLEEPADDAFELPSMDDDLGGAMDETAVISPDETAILTADAEAPDELEFDLSETDAIEEAPAEESTDEEEFSIDIEASELDLDAGETSDEADLDMDLDMSMDSESADEESSDAGDLGMDLDLDMSMGDEEADVEIEAAEADEFDLSEEMQSDDSLEDLTADLEMSVDDADLDLSMDADLGEIDLSEPVDVDEMNTKLDLAKAYLDMGDHDGARDILNEVVAGGNADQKKEANELMAQVS